MKDQEVRELLEHVEYGLDYARETVDRDFDQNNVDSVGRMLVVERAEEAFAKVERYIGEGLKGEGELE